MVNNVNIVIFCSNNIGIGLVLETSEINNSYVLAPESPLSGDDDYESEYKKNIEIIYN